MVTNEVSNTPEVGQSAASEKTLSVDILDTMIQTFKEKQSDKDANPAVTEKIPAEEFAIVNDEEFVKAGALGEKVRDRQALKLQSAIDAADKKLANNPGIHKQIFKLESMELQLQQNAFQQQDKMRDLARNTLSKADMNELSRLGPNPLRDPLINEKTTQFEFNNAQRAWLKENHPGLYKQIEAHDKTSLDIINTNESLRQLTETRDRPFNARIDLARYQHSMGRDGQAIAVLTEAIHTNPSAVTRINKGNALRSLAIDTGAAWDPAFRKAVETNGGNILDFVARPMPHLEKAKLEWKPIPKPMFHPDFQNK